MMQLLQAARLLDAALVGEDVPFSAVSTDSRSIHAGDLFVALRGERHDGHAYLPQVAAGGAVAAMVDARHVAAAPGGSAPLAKLVVPDTREGLGELARHWRRRFDLPLILVVGSNGKTTVKEMIAAILRAHHGEDAELATQGNLNNDIGLPLTILRLRAEQGVAVVELGMNHPGETSSLAAIARPSIGVINNAQREHQEFMHSVEEVAREHARLIAALPQDGVAVINADDAFAPLWREAARAVGASVRDFGLEQPAAVTAECTPGDFSSDLKVRLPEGDVRFTLPVPGQHNVRNALAAAAATGAAGIAPKVIAEGLPRSPSGRCQPRRSRRLPRAHCVRCVARAPAG